MDTVERTRDIIDPGDTSSNETVPPSGVHGVVGLMSFHPLQCKKHIIAAVGPRTRWAIPRRTQTGVLPPLGLAWE